MIIIMSSSRPTNACSRGFIVTLAVFVKSRSRDEEYGSGGQGHRDSDVTTARLSVEPHRVHYTCTGVITADVRTHLMRHSPREKGVRSWFVNASIFKSEQRRPAFGARIFSSRSYAYPCSRI